MAKRYSIKNPDTLRIALVKLKKDPKLVIGNLITDKRTLWCELIDPKTGKLDSYILESTLQFEMDPLFKAAFLKKIHTLCAAEEIQNMDEVQLQKSLNEKLLLSKITNAEKRLQAAEIKRFEEETLKKKIKQMEFEAEQYRIQRNNARMYATGRHSIPIMKDIQNM